MGGSDLLYLLMMGLPLYFLKNGPFIFFLEQMFILSTSVLCRYTHALVYRCFSKIMLSIPLPDFFETTTLQRTLMGIICLCPNGHRTKLKDRFAGLRVRCPQCGEKFRVALTITRRENRQRPYRHLSVKQSSIHHLVTMDQTRDTCVLNPPRPRNRVRVLFRRYSMKTLVSYGELHLPVVSQVAQ